MVYGLAGAHREELKDKQLLALRTELRSNRLNGSGMNKTVRSWCATPYGIKKHGNSVCMTEYLIAARAVMILWANLAVMLAEIVFGAIDRIGAPRRRAVSAPGARHDKAPSAVTESR